MKTNFSDFKKVKKNKSDKNQNLSNDIMVIQDEEGNTVRTEKMPMYNIANLKGLTAEEIDVIARRQTIRDASIESLI